MRRTDRLVLSLATLSAVSASAVALVRPRPAPLAPPAGWHVGSAAPERYELAIDTAVVHGGSASGVLRQAPSGAGDLAASAVQSVRATSYRGQRVRLSAWLRTPDSASVNFWLRVEGLQDDTLSALAMAHTADAPATRSTAWRRVEHVVRVPPNAEALVFGVMLTGAGAVWMDDFQLQVVDDTVASTDRLRAPSPIREAPEEQQRMRARWSALPDRPTNGDFEQGHGTRTP